MLVCGNYRNVDESGEGEVLILDMTVSSSAILKIRIDLVLVFCGGE